MPIVICLVPFGAHITLFTSITMLCGTDNIPWNNVMGIFHGLMTVSRNIINIVMDLNNVMHVNILFISKVGIIVSLSGHIGLPNHVHY